MTSERQRLLAIEIANALNTLQADNQVLSIKHHAERIQLVVRQQKEYVEGVAGQIESMAEPSIHKVLTLCSVGGSVKEPQVPFREEHMTALNNLIDRQVKECTAVNRRHLEQVVMPILKRFFPEDSDGQSV